MWAQGEHLLECFAARTRYEKDILVWGGGGPSSEMARCQLRLSELLDLNAAKAGEPTVRPT